MAKYTVNADQVETTALPGRSVRVLSKALPVERMTLGICEVPPQSSMDPHSHSQEELIYITRGQGYVEVNGTREPVRPGTLIHLPSDAEHFTVNESEEVMQFMFCFSPQVEVGSYDES
jgi:quercetin dioxygenase-like cupin family protein